MEATTKNIKAMLLSELAKQGLSKAELARKMEVSPQEVTRITNPDWPTKVDTLAEMARALGKRLHFSVKKCD